MFEIELEDMGNFIALETNVETLELALMLASAYSNAHPCDSIQERNWLDHKIRIITPELKIL